MQRSGPVDPRTTGNGGSLGRMLQSQREFTPETFRIPRSTAALRRCSCNDPQGHVVGRNDGKAENTAAQEASWAARLPRDPRDAETSAQFGLIGIDAIDESGASSRECN
jgi:hypothetical protein